MWGMRGIQGMRGMWEMRGKLGNAGLLDGYWRIIGSGVVFST